MRGHEGVIAMRRKGVRPDVVWVEVGPDTQLRRDEEKWGYISVNIPETDHVSRLDLRWAVGLMCMVHGASVAAVCAALKRAGAARVIGMSDAGITDTEGVLVG